MINAMTNHESVQYECRFDPKEFSVIAALHSELVLHPVFKDEDLAQEKAAVLNEIRMRQDPPGFRLVDKMRELLFERPYVQTFGHPQDIVNTTAADLQRFREMAYTPDNLFTIVSSPLSPEQVLPILNRDFGKNPRTPTPQQTPALKMTLPKGQIRVATQYHPDVQNSQLCIGFSAPSRKDLRSRMAMEFLKEILNNKESGLLQQTVQNQQQLASYIEAHEGYQPEKETGECHFILHTQPGQEQKTLASTMNTIGQLGNPFTARQVLTPAKLEEVRGRLLSQYKEDMQDSGRRTRIMADNFASDALAYCLEYEKNIKDPHYITPELLIQTAQQYLDPSTYVVSYVLPGQKAPTEFDNPEFNLPESLTKPVEHSPLAAPFIAQAKPHPPLQVAEQTDLQATLSKTLLNGVTAHLQSDSSQAQSHIDIYLPVHSGYTALRQILPELILSGSAVTEQLLVEGKRRGLSVTMNEAGDSMKLSVTGSQGNEREIVHLAMALLNHPKVDPVTFQRLKEQQCQNMRNVEKTPLVTLQDAVNKRLYGENHPYGLTITEAIAALSELSWEKAMNLYDQTAASREGCRVMMVSALTSAEQASLLSQAVETTGWLRSGLPGETLPPPEYFFKLRTQPLGLPIPEQETGPTPPILIPNNSLTKAHIVTAWRTPFISEPDFPVFRVLLTLLANPSPNGHLLNELRSRRGLTYQFDPVLRKHIRGNDFSIHFEVSADKIDSALTGLEKVLQQFIANPATEAELARAKSVCALFQDQDMQSASGIAGFDEQWVQHGLSPIHPNNWTAQLEQVTIQDVQRVAQKYLSPVSGRKVLGITAPQVTLEQLVQQPPAQKTFAA